MVYSYYEPLPTLLTQQEEGKGEEDRDSALPLVNYEASDKRKRNNCCYRSIARR